MQRNKIIDIAKGIGIILVVYTHTRSYFHDAIYIFLMPLFFALSGYFFNEKRQLWDNIKTKFNSLIIPYIFYFLLIQTLYIVVYKLCYIDVFFHWEMFIKPYYVVGPLWFFYGLFFTSIIFSLIYHLFKKTYLIIILSILCGVIGYFLSLYKIQIPLYIDSALSMTLFYCFGYLLRKYNIAEKLNRKISIILGLLTLFIYSLGIILGIENDTKPNAIATNYPLFLFSSLSAILLLLIISKSILRFKYTSNLLSFYGKHSLLVFVFHFLSFYLYFLFFDTKASNLSYFDGFLVTFFALIVSILLGFLQERVLPVPNFRELYKYFKVLIWRSKGQ